MEEDGFTSTDGGIRVDEVTIVLLLVVVVTEWGFGAVVVPIAFAVDGDEDEEGTIVDEWIVCGEQTVLLILSWSIWTPYKRNIKKIEKMND